MRTGYFNSLVFALLTSVSITSIAAPSVKQETGSSTSAREASSQVQSAKVDLNKADAPTLQRELVGIGEAKALAIVAYRDANGSFASVDELLEVKGIGQSILDRNRGRLEVK